jgi:hypothetical protein
MLQMQRKMMKMTRKSFPSEYITAHLNNLLESFKSNNPPVYLPKWERLDVLLNTTQATVNQLEALIWDKVNQSIIPELKGLPYIEINNTLENNKFLAFFEILKAPSAGFEVFSILREFLE